MITSTEPDVELTGRYPIGEAAKKLGIHRNTLRRYTEEGLIKAGFRKTGRKDKFYTGREIKRFWNAQA